MELRLAAAVAKDKRMIAAFQAGEDRTLLRRIPSNVIGRPLNQPTLVCCMALAPQVCGTTQAAWASLTLERAAEVRNEWLDGDQG